MLNMMFRRISRNCCFAAVFAFFLFPFAGKTYSLITIMDTLAYWDFNETSGNTLFDLSGNGHHGKFNKRPGRVAGLDGNAVQFDGNTWAVVKNDGAFNLNGSFRVEMTFKFPDFQYPNSGRWFSNHQEAHWHSGYMLASRSSMGFTFEAYDQYGQMVAETQGGLFGLGKWHTFAMEYDSAAEQLSYFLDDTLKAQFNIDLNGVQYEKTPFIIGCEVFADSTLGNFPCYGIIDEMKIMTVLPNRLARLVILTPSDRAEISSSDSIKWYTGANGPGVTYRLQIATYPLFTQGLVADLPGLGATTVTMGQLAKSFTIPKYTLLFVRVRAEKAGASSAWSPVSSFYLIQGSGVEDDDPAAENSVAASPNPFNPSTAVSFTLARAGAVSVVLYNMGGQKVKTLFKGTAETGRHTYAWDGTDANGKKMNSGTYLLRLESAQYNKTLKLLLLK